MKQEITSQIKKNNDSISKMYKKTCRYLNYIEHLLILGSTITGSVPISVFASLVCVSVGNMSSAVVLKICAITAGTRKYKSIINKKKKKHCQEIMILGKDTLNTTEV